MTASPSFVQQILNEIETLLPLLAQCEIPTTDWSQFADDLEANLLHIVMVGEFNNGKSTFINALIGEELLPTGITPTTSVIHLLSYGEERRLALFRHDGTFDSLPLEPNSLNPLAALDSEDASSVKYAGLTLPNPVLREGIVLVDTPGVNDLNAARSEITYSLIPRADIVLFMLNLSKPLRGTERTFLTETLMKQGLDRFLFIANYADVTDEETDEALTVIRRGLRAIEGLEQTEVLALSALEALQARQTDDAELLELSGMNQLETAIARMIEDGKNETARRTRQQVRLLHLLHEAAEDAENRLDAARRDEKELQQGLLKLAEWPAERQTIKTQIDEYVTQRRLEIDLMLKRSIDVLFERLADDGEHSIRGLRETNPGHLIEHQLVPSIRRGIKNWTERYSSTIDGLLAKLAAAINLGMSGSFDEWVEIKRSPSSLRAYRGEFSMSGYAAQDPILQSGLLVGGVGIAATLLGAPVLIPVLGMAALPYVRGKMIESQINQLKPRLLEDFRSQLAHIRLLFQEEIDVYVNEAIAHMRQEAMLQMERRVEALTELWERECGGIQQNLGERRTEFEQLTRLTESLEASSRLCLEELSSLKKETEGAVT